MRCKDIIERIEQWAPREIAWDRDNAGLQVGSAEREVKKLLITLDLTEPALDKAIEQKCSLILTHHPLLFNPIKKIDTLNDRKSKLIEKLIRNDITLYSAHTNLDYTKDGVSFSLASKLELKNIRFLKPLNSNQSKIVVFVPDDALENVADAIFSAGGGIIGEYTGCSYRTKGKGTFIGSEKSNPALGDKGKFEIVEETRLEVIAESWKIKKIISEIIKTHPYEEPAYDIYPLRNTNEKYGIGAVGETTNPMPADFFLDYISEKLQIKNFRYSGYSNKVISRAAVCGGSGVEYLKDAVKASADVFITADVKYHSFQETDNIILIDAGHYETEIFSLDAIERYLEKSFKEIEIIKFTENPVLFYNNQGAK